MYNRHYGINAKCIMNTLAEEQFVNFIVGRLDEREQKFIMNKRV